MDASKSVLFLCWGCPWPALGGAQLRSLGLLREISREFDLHLLILGQKPPSKEQHQWLSQYASEISWLPQHDTSIKNRLSILGCMVRHLIPYHPALIKHCITQEKEIRKKIERFPGVIFTGLGHWGVLVTEQKAKSWILNQCDADIEFWKVYATQTHSRLASVAARVNWVLAARFFPDVYRRVARIISVCEEDQELTQKVAPTARVYVIENGIDCSYYTPNRATSESSREILFTGTSAARNMVSLHNFVADVLPLVQQQISDVKLLVAGNFSAQAQAEFKQHKNITFTGRVDEILPYFNQSDVYISYFSESHGSKLKIAEAMSMAIPIVSTSAGCRGFPLVHGKSILIGDSKEAFAEHVVTLLQDKSFGRNLGLEARKIALSNIDWQFLGQRLNKIIESI